MQAIIIKLSSAGNALPSNNNIFLNEEEDKMHNKTMRIEAILQAIFLILSLSFVATTVASPQEDYLKGKAAADAKNYAEAVKWWKPAAEQGHMEAQTSLGVLYMTGGGVEQDLDKAKEWLQRAAAQGDENAAGMIEIFDLSGDATNTANAEEGGNLIWWIALLVVGFILFTLFRKKS